MRNTFPSSVFVPSIPARKVEVWPVAKDEIDPEEIEASVEIDDEEEIDLEDLDGDLLDDDLEEDLDEEIDEDDDDEEEDSTGPVVVRRGNEEEDDEDDLVAPDDVEEDLAEILQDRLATEEEPADEEEQPEWDDRTGTEEVLQPKRADEVLCNSCFLLVRQNAPACPVGDDACPVFVK